MTRYSSLEAIVGSDAPLCRSQSEFARIGNRVAPLFFVVVAVAICLVPISSSIRERADSNVACLGSSGCKPQPSKSAAATSTKPTRSADASAKVGASETQSYMGRSSAIDAGAFAATVGSTKSADAEETIGAPKQTAATAGRVAVNHGLAAITRPSDTAIASTAIAFDTVPMPPKRPSEFGSSRKHAGRY